MKSERTRRPNLGVPLENSTGQISALVVLRFRENCWFQRGKPLNFSEVVLVVRSP